MPAEDKQQSANTRPEAFSRHTNCALRLSALCFGITAVARTDIWVILVGFATWPSNWPLAKAKKLYSWCANHQGELHASHSLARAEAQKQPQEPRPCLPGASSGHSYPLAQTLDFALAGCLQGPTKSPCDQQESVCLGGKYLDLQTVAGSRMIEVKLGQEAEMHSDPLHTSSAHRLRRSGWDATSSPPGPMM